ncbi:pyridoxal-phosphate dependent enzyme [Streptomyces cinereoruber]|uniref:pyridoxal-phosphate dependent enzyme n=1 Tax=Streptomyces cinereoruber TaxID=67260 RepID=UPI00345DBB34
MAACTCPRCRVSSPVSALTWCCPRCRGPWDLDFASEPVSLPSLASRVNSLWRYTEALPPLPCAPEETLGEGRTPLVPLTASVSAELDFLMPTLSFKDRGAAVLAAHALRLARAGGLDRVVADSSGNAGTAAAAYCARAGLACRVYVPGGTSPKKAEQIRAHGAEVVEVPGDREAFHAGADDIAGPAAARPTLAEGIAIPAPPRARQILRAVRATGGTFLTVPEERIRAAQRDLARRGLSVEATGTACWAAVDAAPPRPGLTVVPLCGAGAKTGLAP